ncbi:hypothetical protein GF342_03660 [Candidatus Woesearchaeota archaeon]|nr:hypothetical protein [Candidatus Woesearchaeota archaeon]
MAKKQTNAQIVAQYEELKMKSLDRFEVQLAHDILDHDYEDMQVLFTITLIKLEGAEDIEGIIELLDTERPFCTTIQKPILDKQKRLFKELASAMKEAIRILSSKHFKDTDTSKIDPLVRRMHDLLEELQVTSQELLRATGQKIRAA